MLRCVCFSFSVSISLRTVATRVRDGECIYSFLKPGKSWKFLRTLARHLEERRSGKFHYLASDAADSFARCLQGATCRPLVKLYCGHPKDAAFFAAKTLL